MSKLVERVVVKQLMQHINSNNLDHRRQSSYKNGHSTKIALLHIKNKIHLSLSRGEPTTLLNCLMSWFAVCRTALKWFMCYLSHRFQAIKIGSTLSELHLLLFGVPKGSVLDPLLFSLYTTPLSKVTGMHPDNTQLFIRVSQNCSPGF